MLLNYSLKYFQTTYDNIREHLDHFKICLTAIKTSIQSKTKVFNNQNSIFNYQDFKRNLTCLYGNISHVIHFIM